MKKMVWPLLLGHQSIYILPTRRGMGVVLLLAILLLLATNYNNNLIYILAFMVLSVVMVSILHTFRSLAGMEFIAPASAPVFAGETASIELPVKNHSAAPRYEICVSGQDLTGSVGFDLQPQESLRVKLYLRVRQRGWYTLGALTVMSQYPLGFFKAWSPLRMTQRILVYPQPAAHLLPFPTAEDLSQNHAQPHLRGDEFYGFQNYQPGDPIKRIYWKALAKGHGVYSKQYSGCESSEIWLDWARTPGENVEARLSQLCRWVIEAERGNIPYGLRLPGVEIAIACGQAHYYRCLESLALYGG